MAEFGGKEGPEVEVGRVVVVWGGGKRCRLWLTKKCGVRGKVRLEGMVIPICRL